MATKCKARDGNAQNRESQRRSRARRRELIDTLSKQVEEFRRQGVKASLEMQAASRAVSAENQRLRALLALHGVSEAKIDAHLSSPSPSTLPSSAPLTDGVPKTGAKPGKHTQGKPARGTAQRHSCASTRGRRTTDKISFSQKPLAFASNHLTLTVAAGQPSSELASDTDLPTAMASPTATRHIYGVEACFRQGDEHEYGHPGLDLTRILDAQAGSDMLPPLSDSFYSSESSPTDSGCNKALEMSCETAAAILVDLYGHPDPARARVALGCAGTGSCHVKNTAIFKLMEDLGQS
ncbi:hypothetical protein RJ55_04226 [Drechmeria coniospora]|nr:hypothetical protein RJ55_04226 [Drechmeria coniospora]